MEEGPAIRLLKRSSCVGEEKSLKEKRQKAGMSANKIFLLTIRFVFWDVALLTLRDIPEHGRARHTQTNDPKNMERRRIPLAYIHLSFFADKVRPPKKLLPVCPPLKPYLSAPVTCGGPFQL